MSKKVQFELKQFEAYCSELSKIDHYEIEFPIKHSMSIRPTGIVAPAGAKKHALTVMAITHGNEVAGLRVVNDLLNLICNGQLQITVPICIVLGNPDASAKGLRYLERDLNRSFDHSDVSFKEVKRAQEIETVLNDTFLLLDIHQTKENSEFPFFIFPYSKAGFSFAKMISEEIPVVTHWGAPFSKEGMCTDEYTNTQGGCGITLEIGQNGFHPFHVGVGFHGTLKALAVAENLWLESKLPSVDFTEIENPNTYTFSRIIPYPVEGRVELSAGFNNFTPVKKQQVLAKINGQELHAEHSGPVLFPQYMRHGEKVRPAELIRILRKIELSELPEK